MNNTGGWEPLGCIATREEQDPDLPSCRRIWASLQSRGVSLVNYTLDLLQKSELPPLVPPC